jgi:hypothetical protein
LPSTNAWPQAPALVERGVAHGRRGGGAEGALEMKRAQELEERFAVGGVADERPAIQRERRVDVSGIRAARVERVGFGERGQRRPERDCRQQGAQASGGTGTDFAPQISSA